MFTVIRRRVWPSLLLVFQALTFCCLALFIIKYNIWLTAFYCVQISIVSFITSGGITFTKKLRKVNVLHNGIFYLVGNTILGQVRRSVHNFFAFVATACFLSESIPSARTRILASPAARVQST